MGESVAEATVTTWLKKVGDKVEAEEAMVEIATDKVDSEVPAPSNGVILEILVQEGEVAAVGQVIAIIGAEGEASASVPTQTSAPAEAAAKQLEQTVAAAVATTTQSNVDFSDSDRFYSPLVKSIAKEEGIAVNELEQIVGTGQAGRVTKKTFSPTLKIEEMVHPISSSASCSCC